MARVPRSQRDGYLHHVVVRGHNGAPIITRIDDAFRLLERLAEAFEQRGIAVWMWALVINHLHIIGKSPIALLSEAMRVATSPYARYRNERAGARGSFFQDRFWSNPIGDDGYARSSVIYVARNSYTAGHVEAEQLEQHRFCGYGGLFDPEGASLLRVADESVLRLFAPSPEAARVAVRESMAASIAQWEEDKANPTLRGIIRQVAAMRGLPPDVLCSKRRHRWITDARVEVIAKALALRVSPAAIARELKVSRQAIWNLSRRLERNFDDRLDGWKLRLGA